MKKQLLLLTTIFMTTVASFAATYTIHVGSMSFTPSSLTVHPGDVITWVWDNGTHTTTSSLVPIGATSWDKPITSADPSYSYTATVLGTYNYQCNFHVSMGMVGTFYVVSPTGIAPTSPDHIFSLFPNPTSDVIHVQFSQPLIPVTISLTDMTGKQVINTRTNVMIETDLNLRNLPNGSYIITAQQGDNVHKERILVAH